jgi:hypothetical protein
MLFLFRPAEPEREILLHDLQNLIPQNECIDRMVLESQLSPKMVNVLFDITN